MGHVINLAAKGSCCPKCRSTEMHPSEDKRLIRSQTAVDEHGQSWSQCLVCAGYYVKKRIFCLLQLIDTPDQGDSSKGWFAS